MSKFYLLKSTVVVLFLSITSLAFGRTTVTRTINTSNKALENRGLNLKSVISNSSAASSNKTVVFAVENTWVQRKYEGVLSTLFGQIYAKPIGGATQYTFRIKRPGKEQFLTSTTNSTLLSLLPDYTYETPYIVDVIVEVGGVWSVYDQTREVISPKCETQIWGSLQGTVLTSPLGEIYADGVPGATDYRFHITGNGRVDSLESDITLLRLERLPNYGPNIQYTIKVTAKLNGVWIPYGQTYRVTTLGLPVNPQTKLKASFCGKLLNKTGDMEADEVAWATGYRYRVTLGSKVDVLEKQFWYANLNEIPDFAYNTAYSVDVSVETGGVWSAYGPVCTVTTPVLSTNANLSAIALSSGTLSPVFGVNELNYSATVSSVTTSITLSPTLADASATVKVNNTLVASGSASGNILLNVGANTVTTVVTAQDGTTVKTYTVLVTREKQNQTINFPALSTKNVNDLDFYPGASTDSGLPLTYTSSDLNVAHVYQDVNDSNKWKVKIIGDGTTDIVVTQIGNALYNSASATQSLSVYTVLPISLMNYQVKLNNASVIITWATASETTNKNFELWRSIDGFKFDKIATLAGNGTTQKTKLYSFTDQSPASGINYYRLVQIDANGLRNDVGLKTINFSFQEAKRILVYPNPSSNIMNVKFEAGQFKTVELADFSGKILYKKDINMSENYASIAVSGLTPATYLIRLSGILGTVSKVVIVN